MTRSKFLPVDRNDMIERGWDSVDFVYVIGDAEKAGNVLDATHDAMDAALAV